MAERSKASNTLVHGGGPEFESRQGMVNEIRVHIACVHVLNVRHLVFKWGI